MRGYERKIVAIHWNYNKVVKEEYEKVVYALQFNPFDLEK
jgi:hypothetical protein